MLFMKRNKQEPIDEDVDITATSSDEDIKTSTKSISSSFSGLFCRYDSDYDDSYIKWLLSDAENVPVPVILMQSSISPLDVKIPSVDELSKTVEIPDDYIPASTVLPSGDDSDDEDDPVISKYSSNSELVSAFLTSKDAKLLQITAQDKDAAGDYSNIVTVKTIDDVAYFTNTISRIVVTLSYNDFSKAFKYIQSVNAPFSSISFDCNKKIISLYLTPVTIGSSDISNEVTDSPFDITTTEAAQDQSNTDSDITSSAQESSQFDIQYLGGDE